MNTRNNWEQYNMHATRMLQALDNTNICVFMYFPQTGTITIPAKTCDTYHCKPVYKNMPQSFADDYVHPDDHERFNEMYRKIDSGEKTAKALFHSKDFKYYNCVTLTTVSWLDNGKPNEVFGLIENKNELYRNEQLLQEVQSELNYDGVDKEAADTLKIITAAIGGRYNALYYIWLEDYTYKCFQEKLSGVTSLIDEKGDYKASTEIFISKFVLEDDRDAVRKFIDADTLAERLRDKNSISYDYRSDKYNWSRGRFIVGKRDETGKPLTVVYAVSDINAEIVIKKEKQLAEQEALKDSLTGLWNRKAFEEYKDKEMFRDNKAGFILFDIDTFKEINDLYGHEEGDRVIKAVSEYATGVLKQNDIVFRVGGDEFAVLIHNYDENTWNSVCRKITQIHAGLKEKFGGYPKVTISAGLCFNAEGYVDEMYTLADRAMYNTKVKGRSGCTLISLNGDIKEEWFDPHAHIARTADRKEELPVLSNDVLRYNNTGMCQIEIVLDQNKPRRLVCGETAKAVMGIPQNATPEECYTFWRDRIDDSYRETLFQAEQSMIKFGQTECTFKWNHPEHGKIFLRCGGFSEKKGDIIALSGYCHTLKDTHIIEKQDDGDQILKALNETFVSSYYLDLEKETAEPFKISRARDYMSRSAQTLTEILTEFTTTIVDLRDREIMGKFLDVNTLQDRLGDSHFIDAEYRSLVHGCWCRARLLPVKYDRNGKLSNVLLTITALASEKFNEVYTPEYNRRSLAALFDYLPCGAVMYEWNGHSLEMVYTSSYYKENFGHMFVVSDEKEGYLFDFSRIHPEDKKRCHKAVINALNEPNELHEEYRVWVDQSNSYIWEKS